MTQHDSSTTFKFVVINPEPCSDLDEDCAGVRDKHNCADHDKTTGYCPFLAEYLQAKRDYLRGRA